MRDKYFSCAPNFGHSRISFNDCSFMDIELWHSFCYAQRKNFARSQNVLDWKEFQPISFISKNISYIVLMNRQKSHVIFTSAYEEVLHLLPPAIHMLESEKHTRFSKQNQSPMNWRSCLFPDSVWMSVQIVKLAFLFLYWNLALTLYGIGLLTHCAEV